MDLGRLLNARDALPDLTLGNAGVDLFFVISGFVMVYASEPMFRRAGGPLQFMTRRLIRIVPLYWLVTTLYLVMALAIPAFEKSYSVASVVASYLFIPWPRLDGIMQPLVGQGWTLNYEMFFYAIFAAAVLAPRRIAVALASGVLIVAVGAGQLYPPASPILAFWVEPIVLEFVFGMVVGLAYREGFRLPKPVALLTVLGGFALMYVAHGHFKSRLLSLGLPAAVIVAGAAFGDFSLRSPAWRPIAVVGDASYALYLFHSIPVRVILHRRHLDGDRYRGPSLAVSRGRCRRCNRPGRRHLLSVRAPCRAIAAPQNGARKQCANHRKAGGFSSAC